LFADATLQVNREDRIGLVGPNGAGKTTLFSIILGEEASDEGEISCERGTRIGYLPQENAPVSDETVIELATAITPEYTKLRRIPRLGTPTTPPRRCTRRTSMTTSTIDSTSWAATGSRPKPNRCSPA
jgi:ATP-binding cassette subfamily F protein 3